MNFALDQDRRALFALAAAAKVAERQDERMRVFYDDLDREKGKKQERKEREAEERKHLEDMVASTAQLAEFTDHLDTYDGKTVEALMENRQALDKVRDELRRMTEDAYVLPDGRHVFKTADGRQVFDEHGVQLSLKTFDPDTIGDDRPRWETVKAAKDAEGKLVTEQNALIQFQAKVDDARERAGRGDMSKQQLDDLDAGLKAAMPVPVRQKLGYAPAEAGGEMKLRSEDAALADLPLVDEPSRRSLPAPLLR